MRLETAAAAAAVTVVGEVDVGEVGVVPAEITGPPAAVQVMEAEEGVVVVEAEVVAVTVVVVVVVLVSTVEEDTLAVEEGGGKPNNRCWFGQTLNPSHETTPSIVQQISPFSQIPVFFDLSLPGLFALLS